ncbi:MAG: tetratricopeptide repeat protein [Bacteroidia bacterium]|nr:tetratricopeptide repeat protein [Bacteroidia bacterium]
MEKEKFTFVKSQIDSSPVMISPRENFNLQFAELKTCAPENVSKHILAIQETFPSCTRDEQEEFSKKVNDLAWQHAADKPLLYCYARLMHGFFLFYGERYDEAFPLLEETKHLFEEYNDKYGAAICTGLQGSIYRTMGNVDLPLKYMWAAYEQVKTSERFQLFTMAMGVTMGNIYLEQKHYDDALKLYETMLALPRKWFSFYWDVYALHGMGKMCMAQNKPDEAKKYLEEAMAMAEKNNHPLSICNSLSELGNYYNAAGEYDKAEQCHLRALDIREKNDFFSGAITSCIVLGSIYIKQSRFADAMQILEKGMKTAEQIKVKLKMYRIHELLSEIYEQQNDLQQSLVHYKKYHELHDEVEAEDNARKVKNVQMIFAAEQTKKENVIITKQKEEIERKNKELQETIDELTRTRISRKARAITFSIAIILFIFEDFILHFALKIVPENSYWLSMLVKMVIIFSLSPINKAIEKYLLHRLIKERGLSAKGGSSILMPRTTETNLR